MAGMLLSNTHLRAPENYQVILTCLLFFNQVYHYTKISKSLYITSC